jgi:hypothetical protein
MADLFAAPVRKNRAGLPRLSFRFRDKAYQHLRSTLLGKTLLFTDRTDWTDEQIVLAYRTVSSLVYVRTRARALLSGVHLFKHFCTVLSVPLMEYNLTCERNTVTVPLELVVAAHPEPCPSFFKVLHKSRGWITKALGHSRPDQRNLRHGNSQSRRERRTPLCQHARAADSGGACGCSRSCLTELLHALPPVQARGGQG